MAKLRTQRTRFVTMLSVKECGLGFRSAIESTQGAFGRIVSTVANGLEFYTPEPSSDDAPFNVLDDDRPVFEVGANVPFMGKHDNGVSVHLYVWERDDCREVLLEGRHWLGGGSRATKLLEIVRSEIESR